MEPYGLVLVTPPADTPVNTAEAKAHVRQDESDDDTLIGDLVDAAVEYVQSEAGIQLMTATYRLELEHFPGQELLPRLVIATPRIVLGGLPPERLAIRVPRPPLQSVTSIQYLDTDGETQTLASSEYTVDTAHTPGRIVPTWGKTWPAVRVQPGAVKVTYVAGYASAALVPAAAKQAIKLLVGHWYESREAVVTGTIATSLPAGVDSLIRKLWTGVYL